MAIQPDTQTINLSSIDFSMPNLIVGEKVGEGTYKTVYECHHPDLPGTTFALVNVDVYRLKRNAVDHLKAMGRTAHENAVGEARNLLKLRNLGNPNIPLILSTPKLDKKKGIYYWVEELVEYSKPDFFSKEPMHEYVVTELLVQYASALKAAHSRGIIHGDLSESNSGRTGRTIKVLDWGLCSSMLKNPYSNSKGEQGVQLLGNGFTRAYEQFRGMNPDEKSDSWALGVLGFRMKYGRYPFMWTFDGTPEDWQRLSYHQKRDWEQDIEFKIHTYFNMFGAVMNCDGIRDNPVEQAKSLLDYSFRVKPSSGDHTILHGLDRIILDLLHPDPDKRISTAEAHDRLAQLKKEARDPKSKLDYYVIDRHDDRRQAAYIEEVTFPPSNVQVFKDFIIVDKSGLDIPYSLDIGLIRKQPEDISSDKSAI